jgi:hypothetical protein
VFLGELSRTYNGNGVSVVDHSVVVVGGGGGVGIGVFVFVFAVVVVIVEKLRIVRRGMGGMNL